MKMTIAEAVEYSTEFDISLLGTDELVIDAETRENTIAEWKWLLGFEPDCESELWQVALKELESDGELFVRLNGSAVDLLDWFRGEAEHWCCFEVSVQTGSDDWVWLLIERLKGFILRCGGYSSMVPVRAPALASLH